MLKTDEAFEMISHGVLQPDPLSVSCLPVLLVEALEMLVLGTRVGVFDMVLSAPVLEETEVEGKDCSASCPPFLSFFEEPILLLTTR